MPSAAALVSPETVEVAQAAARRLDAALDRLRSQLPAEPWEVGPGERVTSNRLFVLSLRDGLLSTVPGARETAERHLAAALRAVASPA